MADENATATAQTTTEAANGAQTGSEQGKEASATATATGNETKTGENTTEQGKTAPPEKYELKLPEDSLLDPSHIEKISAYAKEKGLSNEAAQAELERDHQVVKAFKDAELNKVKEIQDGWVRECEADKEIGGESFKQNAELAKRVIERVASDNFKTILRETGFGNHPEVVRTFVRIGKMMADDQLVVPKSQTGSGDGKSAAEVLYPDMK